MPGHDRPTGDDQPVALDGERPELDALIDRADVDALVRAVDALGEHRDWGGLMALARKCRGGPEQGRQLWPVAALIEYRVALRAPAGFVAPVLAAGSARFSLGPLTEVAASTHAWDELADHLDPGAVPTTFCAHERVVRGEDLRGDEKVDVAILELPLVLEPWEPAYPVATYEDAGAHFPAPSRPAPRLRPLGPADRPYSDPGVLDALRALVEPWTSSSNGRIDVVAVEGDAAGAVAALGPAHAGLAPLAPAEALAWLAWAGASGGAHGRRRGAATGRFGAWWALAALAGMPDQWPVPAPELGAAAAELEWYWWDAGEPARGWELRIAVADPADGLAWALTATDQA